MKKKFYYKDQLIRTSSHDYQYAVVVEKPNSPLRLCGCTEKLANAYKMAKEEKSYWEKAKIGLPKFKETLSQEAYQDYMAEYENNIQHIRIVRLEVR